MSEIYKIRDGLTCHFEAADGGAVVAVVTEDNVAKRHALSAADHSSTNQFARIDVRIEDGQLTKTDSFESIRWPLEKAAAQIAVATTIGETNNFPHTPVRAPHGERSMGLWADLIAA